MGWAQDHHLEEGLWPAPGLPFVEVLFLVQTGAGAARSGLALLVRAFSQIGVVFLG